MIYTYKKLTQVRCALHLTYQDYYMKMRVKANHVETPTLLQVNDEIASDITKCLCNVRL